MIDRDFTAVLQEVGFDEKEARVYLAASELKNGSATQIAARAELNRPVVYYLIDRLKARGYVQDVPGSKVKRFSAVDPARILYKAQSAVEELRFMVPLMRALQDKGGTKPRIEYLEGKEAVRSTYKLFEKRKGGRFLSSIKQLDNILHDETETWIRRHETNRSKQKARAHLLANTPEDRAWGERATKAGQRVRILPKHVNLKMDFSMVDEILTITSFDPIFILVVHSEPIASSAAALFDLAWEMSEEITV